MKYRLRKWAKYHLLPLVLWFWPRYCDWHRGDEAVDWDECPPSCPDCGCLLWTRLCCRCRNEFLDFGAKGFDDVMVAPRVTSGGDLACVRCANRIERDEEQQAKDEAEYYG